MDKHLHRHACRTSTQADRRDRPTPKISCQHQCSEHYRINVRSTVWFSQDVLHHYRTNVWPKVAAIVASHSNQTSAPRIILEGSALWPGFVTSLDFNRVAALWLTASEELFRQRIHQESRSSYPGPSFERTMVDKFPERTLVYNAKMTERLPVGLISSSWTLSQSRCGRANRKVPVNTQNGPSKPGWLAFAYADYADEVSRTAHRIYGRQNYADHCSFPSFTTRHSPEITDKLRDVPRCPGVGITPPAI